MKRASSSVRGREGGKMTEEQQTVLAIKEMIAQLPPATREQTEAVAEHFRRMIRDAGTFNGARNASVRVGQLALALVGAELDAEEW